MTKKEDLQLIEGAKYRVFSIGGRDSTLESEGIFQGFASLGIEEAGILIELGSVHKNLKGTIRIIPLHAILAIDILDEIAKEKRADEREPSHYYG